MKKTTEFIRTLGFIPGIIGGMALFPLLFALLWGESSMIFPFALPLAFGILTILPGVLRRLFPGTPKKYSALSVRQGFLLVFLIWIGGGFLGALPYYLAGLGLSFGEAFFESACGLATTAGTVFANPETLPRSLLLWRALTHWFGGIGILILTVVRLPLLGIGGFQLLKSEDSEHDKGQITPKLAAAARFLAAAYGGMTLVLALLYRLGGMSWFDAVCHALTALASGGISVKSQGLAFYNSAFIEGVTVVFMLLAGMNFSVLYRAARGRFKSLAGNSELRAYGLIFLAASILLIWQILPMYGSLEAALRYGVFHAASFFTTTGFVISDLSNWPAMAVGILMALTFIGGCSGSVTGGFKVIRLVTLAKQASIELRRIVNPRGVFVLQIDRKVGDREVINGMAGFGFLYLALLGITTLAASASGADLFSSFSAAYAITSTSGAGLGTLGAGGNYAGLPSFLNWFFAFATLAGRLEIWAIAILLNPEYWRR